MPWILIWVLISVFIIGIFVWSLDILFRQKREWRRFAGRHGLEYNKGKLMQSPVVIGELSGYTFHLYSEEQLTAERGGRRFRTVLHFALPGGMPTSGFIATSDYKELADTLDLPQKIVPDHEQWPKNNVGRAADAGALTPYFTENRIKAIARLCQMQKASTVFVFDETETYLRVETADPLQDADRIDRITQRMIKVADTLALQEGESEALNSSKSAESAETEVRQNDTQESDVDEGGEDSDDSGQNSKA